MNNESDSYFDHNPIEIAKIALSRTDLNYIDDIYKYIFLYALQDLIKITPWTDLVYLKHGIEMKL